MTVKTKLIPKQAILDGVLLEDIELVGSTDNIIQHGLEREFRGAIVVLANNQSHVYFDQTDNRSPSTQLYAQTAEDVTVSLWIF